jgi:glutamate racemase
MNASDAFQLPIGVFDSGVGGLTVLAALQTELPDENLTYLGDTARLPYGTKSPESIARYAGQAARVLQERGIKMLVVACNTASAVALAALQRQLAPLPVVGVVEPGAAAAVAAKPSGRHLVLATEATVRLSAYRRSILALDDTAAVEELACEMLVALAEEGWNDGDLAVSIVRRYVDCVSDEFARPDCVILGCTHFPLLRPAIEQVFDASAAIVDSASTTASLVATHLRRLGLANVTGHPRKVEFLATDGARRFASVGGHFLGADLAESDISIIDL